MKKLQTPSPPSGRIGAKACLIRLRRFASPFLSAIPDAEKILATYILTIEPGAKTGDFSRYAERAKKRGWTYYELPTGHNAQRTMPKEYAALLMSVE